MRSTTIGDLASKALTPSAVRAKPLISKGSLEEEGADKGSTQLPDKTRGTYGPSRKGGKASWYQNNKMTMEQRRKMVDPWTQSRIKKSKTVPTMSTTQSRIKSNPTTMSTTDDSNNNNNDGKAYEPMKMVADQTDAGYATGEKRFNEFALENKYPKLDHLTKTQMLG
jgi:hypothetical protein